MHMHMHMHMHISLGGPASRPLARLMCMPGLSRRDLGTLALRKIGASSTCCAATATRTRTTRVHADRGTLRASPPSRGNDVGGLRASASCYPAPHVCARVLCPARAGGVALAAAFAGGGVGVEGSGHGTPLLWLASRAPLRLQLEAAASSSEASSERTLPLHSGEARLFCRSGQAEGGADHRGKPSLPGSRL